MRARQRTVVVAAALMVASLGALPAARAADGPSSTPDWLVAHNGFVWFAAFDGSENSLWKSDGTPVNTQIVYHDVLPSFLTWAGPQLFFSGYDSSHGRELWVSQGTLDDTQMVVNATPGTGNTLINNMVAFGNRVFYTVADPTVGLEPWISDGTPTGTHLLKDINAGAGGSGVYSGVALGSKFLLVANDTIHGQELWVTDGTKTHLLRDIQPGVQSSFPSGFTLYKGHVLFAADDGVHGREVWTTDGTTAGTHLLKDIDPGTSGGLTLAFGQFDLYGGLLYFGANDGVHNMELWRTDGTPAGTKLAVDVWPGPRAGSPGFTVNAAGKMLFPAQDATHGTELWRSNGHPAGTSFVKDITPGAKSGMALLNPLPISLGTVAVFGVDDGVHGVEPYVSDGTPVGSHVLLNINPGAASSNPSDLVRVGTRAFFAADDGTHGKELWVTDGTRTGTTMVTDIYP